MSRDRHNFSERRVQYTENVQQEATQLIPPYIDHVATLPCNLSQIFC